MTKLKKYTFIVFGTLALVLGIIGIFLPILPTTPFLLLASFFYVRSSKKLNHWLLNHKYFGAYLTDYIEYKAIKKSNRRYSLTFLWFTLITAMIVSQQIWLVCLLIVIGSSVTFHIMHLNLIEDK